MAGINLQIPFAEGGVPGENLLRSSDAYTKNTNIYFTVHSDKIVLQGAPFKSFTAFEPKMPQLNPNQYRVVKLKMPDPNSFSVLTQAMTLKDKKYLWQLKGFRINTDDEQVQLAEGSYDTFGYIGSNKMMYEPPLKQQIILGCQPALGYHFVVNNRNPPTLEENCMLCCKDCCECNLEAEDAVESTLYLSNPVITQIQDGDFANMGFGNYLVNTDQDGRLMPSTMANNLNVPFKNLAKIDMKAEQTGDRDYFVFERYQSHARGFDAMISSKEQDKTAEIETIYFEETDGSVKSNLNDLFNKTYWLNKADGPNNCLAWNDEFIFTFLDNTRGQVMIFNKTKKTEVTHKQIVARMIRTFQIEAVIHLVEVTLEAELLQYIYRMNKQLLANWGYGFEMMKKEGSSYQNLNLQKAEEEERERPEEKFIEINFNGSTTHKMYKDLHISDIGRQFKQSFNIPSQIVKRKR